MPDGRVRADAGRRAVGIGGVPEPGRPLLPARPALETVAVTGAVLKQVRRARKAVGVAPDAGQPVARLGDEILQIAFPAAAVVGEEQQFVGARQKNPARKMNRADIRQEARAKRGRRQLRDDPIGDPKSQLAHPPRFHHRDPGEMVLVAVVLAGHDLGEHGAIGRRVVGLVGILLCAQARIQRVDDPAQHDRCGNDRDDEHAQCKKRAANAPGIGRDRERSEAGEHDVRPAERPDAARAESKRQRDGAWILRRRLQQLDGLRVEERRQFRIAFDPGTHRLQHLERRPVKRAFGHNVADVASRARIRA